jgi:outer membrane protein assembly factor BamA
MLSGARFPFEDLFPSQLILTTYVRALEYTVTKVTAICLARSKWFCDYTGCNKSYELGLSIFQKYGGNNRIRSHLFINAGQLLARPNNLHQIGAFLPSISIGAGLAVALPQCRLEANLTTPIVMQVRDRLSPGYSVGIGVSFL